MGGFPHGAGIPLRVMMRGMPVDPSRAVALAQEDPQPLTMAASLALLDQVAPVSRSRLHEMVPWLRLRTYARRERLLDEMSSTPAMLLLLRGTVRVSLLSDAGHELVISTHGPGELLGEAMLVDDEASPYTLTALETCEVLYIPRYAALTLWDGCADNPLWAITAILARRLRSADRMLARIAFMQVRERVAVVVMESAKLHSGELRVGVSVSDISCMVAASREMVSRVLAQMVKDGYIRRARRRIVIIDRMGLAAMVAGG